MASSKAKQKPKVPPTGTASGKAKTALPVTVQTSSAMLGDNPLQRNGRMGPKQKGRC